jgi:hypothetical protein
MLVKERRTAEQYTGIINEKFPDEHKRYIATVAFGWYIRGLPRLVFRHRHAASLMATSVPYDIAEDVDLPWDIFALDVPDGLVDVSQNYEVPAYVRHVVVQRLLDKKISIIVLLEGEIYERFTLGYHYEYDTNAPPYVELLTRYVVGAMLSLDRSGIDTYRAKTSIGIKRNPRGAPVTWTFEVRREVKIDCRKAIHDYSRGIRNNPLTLQSLVRGHWKMQPCGPESTKRKRIHVEPYWRGPDDAPIALRAHHVVDPKET